MANKNLAKITKAGKQIYGKQAYGKQKLAN